MSDFPVLDASRLIETNEFGRVIFDTFPSIEPYPGDPPEQIFDRGGGCATRCQSFFSLPRLKKTQRDSGTCRMELDLTNPQTKAKRGSSGAARWAGCSTMRARRGQSKDTLASETSSGGKRNEAAREKQHHSAR